MQKEGIKNLEIAILFSALLHIIILYAFRYNMLHVSPVINQPQKYIELSTVPPEDLKSENAEPVPEKNDMLPKKNDRQKLVLKNQIVDIPKPLVQQEPKKTAYLSNWSQSVNEEMVSKHKGGGYGTDGLKSLEVSAKPQVPEAGNEKTIPKPPEAKPLADEEGLTSNPKDTLSLKQHNSSQSGKDQKLALNSLLPSYSRMRENQGIGDNNYLPGLKEGDVTLLNTKSFVYAGFVRRVAYRIFDQFIFDMRNSDISPDEINNINSHAYIEANMNQAGKLISVKLLRSSGSPAWDHMAIEACKDATWDANPPKGAEGKDGVIHFVFAPGKDVLVVGLLD